jgi:CMP-2-keto-3-deoxyoctulosonic acid synthetase
MRTVITVYKDRKGYVIIINGGKSKGHTLKSHNPELAAETALESWEEHRDNPDGIFVSVPAEVEALISKRGPIPWERSNEPTL